MGESLIHKKLFSYNQFVNISVHFSLSVSLHQVTWGRVLPHPFSDPGEAAHHSVEGLKHPSPWTPAGLSHCLTVLLLSPPWSPQGPSPSMESRERDAGPSPRRSASLLGTWGRIHCQHKASMMSQLSQVQEGVLLVCDCSQVASVCCSANYYANVRLADTLPFNCLGN